MIGSLLSERGAERYPVENTSKICTVLPCFLFSRFPFISVVVARIETRLKIR